MLGYTNVRFWVAPRRNYQFANRKCLPRTWIYDSNGKGDKQRFVPLGELSKISLATYIRKYRNEAKESEPVFVNRFGEKCTINTVKQVFQKLKKQTGILRLHAHLLRHTFATNYLVDGGDLETLRLLMGHSDLQVTTMYLHLAENKKLLQRKHQSHLDMIINS